MDCKHSPPLTTLCFSRATKLRIVVRPLACARNGNDPKGCHVTSSRKDCHGIYPQRDSKKPNNHWTSIETINRMSLVCPGHFLSTLKSSISDWVRTSSMEKLFVFYSIVDGCSYRRRRAMLTVAQVSLIRKFIITNLDKRKYKFKTRDYGTDQCSIRVIAPYSMNPLYYITELLSMNKHMQAILRY